MAEKAIKEQPYNPMTDLVTVTLPRATGKEETELFVALNGKGYIIKKGIPVRVPRPVADIIEESERHRRRQDAFRESLRAR